MTTGRHNNISAVRAFTFLAGLSIVAAIAAAAIGWAPTQALAGADGLVASGVGMGISLLAALVGILPIVLFWRLGPRERVNGVLLAMAVRFVLTLGILVVVMFTASLPRAPLALWTAIGYMVLLMADTVGILWLFRSTEGASS